MALFAQIKPSTYLQSNLSIRRLLSFLRLAGDPSFGKQGCYPHPTYLYLATFSWALFLLSASKAVIFIKYLPSQISNRIASGLLGVLDLSVLGDSSPRGRSLLHRLADFTVAVVALLVPEPQGSVGKFR